MTAGTGGDADLDRPDIAIIGMAGQFPGAPTVRALWQNLCKGYEAVTRFSDEELRRAGVPEDLLTHPNYVKAGPVLAGIDSFDAGFFGYPPKEAQVLDPQQRLFLENAWTALEDAGYAPGTVDVPVGVFAGAALSTYLFNNLARRPDLLESVGQIQLALANDKDSLSTRTAYALGLSGPAFAVQSYCSTSLIAVCTAATSLLSGECDLALAGGVAVAVPQTAGYLYQEGGMASPDGRCRAFDAEARGAPIGNGVGVVVLKRLADAVRDRDHVYAAIRGYAMNNDGALKAGFTAPGVRGQAGVVAEALADAELTADDVDYVEAHGTGTALGDAAEMTALAQAFAASGGRDRPCLIGSVKTNLGHLDRAAGVTGLIKTTLALHHGMIPPTVNFERPNPAIDLHRGPFQVVTEPRDWPRLGRPPRAGVSAFGIGGTNAHVVLEAAPPVAGDRPSRPSLILPVSARTERAADEQLENLARYLREDGAHDLADVAFTLQVGRQAFEHRRVLVCGGRDEALAALTAAADEPAGRVLRSGPVAAEPRVVLLLPGERDADLGYAWRLADVEPTYRGAVTECLELLRAGGGPASLTELREDGGPVAAVVAQYALARLLLEWGVRPHAFVGSGSGRLLAECLDGTLGLRDVLPTLAAGRPDSAVAAPSLDAVDLDAAGELRITAGGTSCLPGDLVCAGPAETEPDGQRALLGAVARMWLHGVPVDWAAVSRHENRARVPLPTYPFQRQVYWVDPLPAGAPAAPAAAPEQAPGEPAGDVGEWFHQPVWRNEDASGGEEPAGPVLVFADRRGVADALEAGLARDGTPVVRVEPGPEFDVLPGGIVRMRPDAGPDYRELVQHLAEHGLLPRTVAHLWLVDGGRDDLDDEGLARVQAHGFTSLYLLAAALGEEMFSPVRIAVVSDGMQGVGDRLPAPGKTLALGPCLVVPQEYPLLSCRSVDLPPAPDAGHWPARLARWVRTELGWPGAAMQVAYAGETRFVREVERLEAPAPARIRAGGTYLITGGLGGVGLVLAEHLARSGAGHVVLTSRGGPPVVPAGAAADDESGRRAQRIDGLRRLGARVTVVAADATDERRMREVVDDVLRETGRLDGVVHAAGVTGVETFRSIANLTEDVVRGHLLPKVAGTLALERALRGVPLDFCVLQSSMSAVLGGLGFASYAAANVFLDAVADRRRGQGNWVSVNWDTWESTAQKMGDSGLGVAMTDYSMTDEQARDAFDRVIGVPRHRLILATGGLSERMAQWLAPHEAAGGAIATYPRPDLADEYVAPRDDLERHVARLWQEMLGIEPIGIDDNFFDLGGNSLVGLQLINRVTREYRTNIPAVALMEAPTIRTLAKYLAGAGEADPA